MCGIFFSIGFENLSGSVIDSVAHRGPDGRGWNEFMSSQGPVVTKSFSANSIIAGIPAKLIGKTVVDPLNGRVILEYIKK